MILLNLIFSRYCNGAFSLLAAQGSGWVTIPGEVQETCRCGTLGYGLVGMVVLGWRLDLKILEVFSNLNNSVILWFYEHTRTEVEFD